MEKSIQGYELPIAAVAGALICAGNQDMRYYLNGVYVDFPRGRIVATDGHRLFVGAIPPAECEPVIVPRALCEKLLKAHKGLKKRERETLLAVALSISGEPRTVTLNHVCAGVVLTDAAVDGRFPDYERVIPPADDEALGTVGQFDLQYLADAGQALALYARSENRNGTHYCYVEHHGPNTAAIIGRIGYEAFVVVMPIRGTDIDKLDRSWFNATPEAVSA